MPVHQKLYEHTKDGIRLVVKVTPKSSKAQVTVITEDLFGRCVIKVSVTAPPSDGKANEAVIQVIAKAIGIPPSSICITSGASSRIKTLVISASDMDALTKKVASWAETVIR